MSQSYTPGTILSVGFGPTLEQVIVLSGDKVATKTFGGKPVERRDIVSMADWCVLIGGQKIQTDYLELPPNPLLPRNLPRPANTYAAPESGQGYLADLSRGADAGSSSASLELSNLLAKYGATSVGQAMSMTVVPDTILAANDPQAQAQVAPEPEKVYPVGTKLSWKPTDETDRWYSPNSRTAIVLKDGVLQVKEVINQVPTMATKPGATHETCARKFFSTVADWKAQLPAGGSITASEVTEDMSVPSIQRKAKAPVNTTSDINYIDEIEKRFSIHAYLEEGFTPAERLASEVIVIRENMTVINDLTTPLSLSTTRAPQDIANALDKAYYASLRVCRASKRAKRIQTNICVEPSKALIAPLYFTNDYKQRLVAFVGGREIDITTTSCYAKVALIGLAGNPDKGHFGKWFSPKVGKTFAELGIDMKADGKPRLKAYYRRESIEL